MFVSRLFPEASRPARLWLRNRYRIHQRLCMAFPTAAQHERDPDFLLPFEPQGFSIHAPRDSGRNFLFRIDPNPRAGGGGVLVVQSAIRPDWGYAFRNAEHLVRRHQTREFSPRFVSGQMRFRLEANPTRRLRETKKRVPVPDTELMAWLDRHAERGGFRLCGDPALTTGYAIAKNECLLRSVRFEGLLEVADPVRLRNTVISGIGSGKAFGFGLLSVVPL